MRQFGNMWLYSPRDVLAVLECEHRLKLEHAAAHGLVERPPQGDDATLELVKAHGLRHERAVLDELRDGLGVVTIDTPGHDELALIDAGRATEAAMDAGAPVIYQAVLLVDGFLGYADFLLGVDLATGAPLCDEQGRQLYEPVDTKLARHAKTTALLQVACYADALVRLGRTPRRVHLWLGDGAREVVPAADVLPLAREYRERVLARLGQDATAPVPLWGDARPACGTCNWQDHCADGRRAARDLSLVAGMRREQIVRLRAGGLSTVDALAGAGDDLRPPSMGGDTWARLRAQAALQVSGATSSPPLHEVFDPTGLALLPATDPGDLYYDIEGDPFAEHGAGLEYLHGIVDTAEEFTAFWAHSRAEEKHAFEQVVDTFTAAASANPAMHVYHYAPYERTALTTLAARHATREDEVDQLLRDGRLIDLYAVVRRSVRVSTESYSIKKLEPLYMGERLRAGEVTNAGDSIVEYENAVADRQAGRHAEADGLLEEIRDYNEYDCVSTHRLHRWLLSLRSTTPTTTPAAPSVPQERVPPAAELLAERLRDTVPDTDRSPEQQAIALLAAALGYHRRNQKTFWWEHFDRLRRPLAELMDEDAVVVLERPSATEWAKPTPRSNLARTVTAATGSTPEDVGVLGQQPFVVYGPPLPEHLDPSADSDRATHTGVVSLDATEGWLSVVERAPKGSDGWSQLPLALTPAAPPFTGPLEAALGKLGEQLLAGDARDAAWFRLLTANAPGTDLPRTGDSVADITAAVAALNHGVLAVQGPPGTGKTYVGSHVIAALAHRGWRIGVTAQSHKVVENLLARVVELGATVAKEPREDGAPWQTPKKLAEWMDKQEGGWVVGGTAWTFAREGVRAHALDLMVVDEAGQFSLPDALVTGSAATRILLLGDPQQLPQVSQGQHPEPVDVSALGHVLGEHALIPATHGYLLDVTWRMRPEVCAPVSALQYEGALHSHERCTRRTLHGVPPGVQPVEVDHHDNRTRSDEEVTAVIALIGELLGARWTDVDAIPRPLSQDDVLVVAPFNRQVAALRRGLREAGFGEVAVGTVDKFQGREAAVVIVSMTTSSGEDLPRGVEFLLSRNRLNVALSRAMHTAYLVHSPLLRRITPTSTTGLRSLGAFLGVLHSV